MPDREKVIKGLSCCAKWMEKDDAEACISCPYHGNFNFDDHGCIEEVNNDAIALLKEQEAKTGKWILDDEDANSWECSECGGLLLINDGTPHENDWYYCPYCGSKLEEQAVKWE